MKKYPLYTTKCIRDLKELTDTSTRLYAQKDAFQIMTGIKEYKSVSYEKFGKDLSALANALLDKEFSNLRIALIGENSYQWILSYFAIVNSNATVVPLDKELTKEEILTFVQRSKATVFFFSDTYKDEVKYVTDNVSDIYTISFGEKGEAETTLDELIKQGKTMVENGQDRYSNIEIDRARTCSILFTSGTTGTSKGVELTHRSLSANIVSATELVKFTTDDVLLSVLPIHHAYEDMCGIFGPIKLGATIAFCKGVKQLPTCLTLFRPTVMALVPLYLETFDKRIWESANKQGKEGKLKVAVFLGNMMSALGLDIRDKLLHDVRAFFGGRLKIVIAGGAYLNPELVKSFRGFGITVLNGYGLTECSPIISANRNKSHKDKSVGWVASCCDVCFDEDGQILVKGESLMKGYLDDEQGTAEAFDGEWFKTGDLGFQDKDGFLYITGRCKNLIVLKNGKNIMPEEIEYHIGKSPLVAEVMVKEANSDANGADSLMAIIYPNPNLTKDMNEWELRNAIQTEIDKVNQTLVYYKKIHQFELRASELPKTTTKKIMRYKV